MATTERDMGLAVPGRASSPLEGRAGPEEERATLTPEEFTTRFGEASPSLWCIAVAVLGGRSEAEDVIQDAAAIALSKLDAFDRGTSFAAWMGEIVRNVARNHARKQDRRRTSTADPQTIDAVRPAAGPPSGGVLRPDLSVREDQGEFDDRLMAALGRLEETARICLLLRTLESMSYRDISRVLAIPEGTAMSHVHRSRRTLRETLGGGGGEAQGGGRA